MQPFVLGGRLPPAGRVLEGLADQEAAPTHMQHTAYTGIRAVHCAFAGLWQSTPRPPDMALIRCDRCARSIAPYPPEPRPSQPLPQQLPRTPALWRSSPPPSCGCYGTSTTTSRTTRGSRWGQGAVGKCCGPDEAHYGTGTSTFSVPGLNEASLLAQSRNCPCQASVPVLHPPRSNRHATTWRQPSCLRLARGQPLRRRTG